MNASVMIVTQDRVIDVSEAAKVGGGIVAALVIAWLLSILTSRID